MGSIILNAVLVALLVPLVFIIGCMNGHPALGFMGAAVAMCCGVKVTCKLDELHHENATLRRVYRGRAF